MKWRRAKREAKALQAASKAEAARAAEKRTSIRTKFLLMMLPMTLLGLAIITFYASQTGKQALTDAAFNQLTSYRAAKKQQVERYFHDVRETFSVLGSAPGVIAAFKDLKAGYDTFGAPVSAERRQKLVKYYQDEFLPTLADENGRMPSKEEFLPGLHNAFELQSLYIAENPFKGSERRQLTAHPTENAYTLAHARHHAWLRSIAEKLNYYDLFLIDVKDAAIIYTVDKEPDFGTSLTVGPYASTKLGLLVRSVIEEQKRDLVKLADYSLYAASGNAPSAFMAMPIYDGLQFIGVLAAQLSTEPIDNFMNNHRSWREQGLGETGGAYLAGADGLMRSNSREMIEKPDEYLKKIEAAGFLPVHTVQQMRRDKTTILFYPANKDPLIETAKGKSGAIVLPSRKGGNVLISYAPLDIPDVQWSVLTRMDEHEVLKAQNQFNRNVLTVACTLALLSTLAALWMARSFMRPVTALLDGIERLRKGERDVTIPENTRDEFGDLVYAFNAMSADIKRRDEVIEGKNRAYAQLLKRIFPETVADRLKQGEAHIAESFKQVTVIYAVVDGLAMSAEKLGTEAATKILNEIVDAFDNVAERTGVEKVKTVGDHYLAVCGLDVARLDHAKRSFDFSIALYREITTINQNHNLDLNLRTGIATGSAQAGLVGNRRFVYDIWGLAASIARRIVYDADLDSLRMNTETYEALSDKTGIGEMLEVKTKALGTIKTYQYLFNSADRDEASKKSKTSVKAAE